jgi:1-phosphofructokinase family hexose kinase
MAVASAPAIATVTLNPALDEAIAIDELILGETNRCALDALDPGGKGINASRVIQRLGRATLAFGFIGGVTGQLLRARLEAEGLPHDFDVVGELTRLNVMLYERGSGRRSRLYLPGARVEPAQAAALLARLEQRERGSLVVLGGSVPPGLPDTIYRDVVSSLRARDIRPIVDTSGAPLEAVLAARPLLIKPNVEEAEALLGRQLAGDDATLAAANEIRGRGPEYVVISLGADGAIGVGPEGAWKVTPPAIEARSTVGSGDSMIAGLAIGFNEGLGFVEALRLGTAAGAATAMVAGTQLCSAAQIAHLLPGVAIRSLAAAQTR